MKPTLRPGLTHRFTYKVPRNKAWDKVHARVAEKAQKTAVSV